MDLLERLEAARTFAMRAQSNLRIYDLYRAMRFTQSGTQESPSVTITTCDRSWRCCATGDDYEALCNMSDGELSVCISDCLHRAIEMQCALDIASSDLVVILKPLGTNY